ncbi:programmed cell death 6-interacting protein [Sesbania bispinosa]|nr:programmed cell death 6-interacting protein [Sesbania bispinosa]
MAGGQWWSYTSAPANHNSASASTGPIFLYQFLWHSSFHCNLILWNSRVYHAHMCRFKRWRKQELKGLKMMLHFVQPSKLKTKKIVFEDVYAVCDSATLEHLKELSSKRKAIEESINESSFITEAIAKEMAGGLESRYEQVTAYGVCMSPFTPIVLNENDNIFDP